MSWEDDDGSSGWHCGPAKAFKYDIFQITGEKKSSGRKRREYPTTFKKKKSRPGCNNCASHSFLSLRTNAKFLQVSPSYDTVTFQRNPLQIKDDCWQWREIALYYIPKPCLPPNGPLVLAAAALFSLHKNRSGRLLKMSPLNGRAMMEAGRSFKWPMRPLIKWLKW